MYWTGRLKKQKNKNKTRDGAVIDKSVGSASFITDGKNIVVDIKIFVYNIKLRIPPPHTHIHTHETHVITKEERRRRRRSGGG